VALLSQEQEAKSCMTQNNHIVN